MRQADLEAGKASRNGSSPAGSAAWSASARRPRRPLSPVTGPGPRVPQLGRDVEAEDLGQHPLQVPVSSSIGPTSAASPRSTVYSRSRSDVPRLGGRQLGDHQPRERRGRVRRGEVARHLVVDGILGSRVKPYRSSHRPPRRHWTPSARRPRASGGTSRPTVRLGSGPSAGARAGRRPRSPRRPARRAVGPDLQQHVGPGLDRPSAAPTAPGRQRRTRNPTRPAPRRTGCSARSSTPRDCPSPALLLQPFHVEPDRPTEQHIEVLEWDVRRVGQVQTGQHLPGRGQGAVVADPLQVRLEVEASPLSLGHHSALLRARDRPRPRPQR